MDFVNTSPSVLATAALATAIRAVLPHQSHASWSGVLSKAHEVTGIDSRTIEDWVHRIGKVIAATGPALKQLATSTHSAAMTAATKCSISLSHKTVICNSAHQLSATPETPTDVQDVLF